MLDDIGALCNIQTALDALLDEQNGTAIGGNSFPLSAVRPAKETVREWKATLQEAND